MVSLARNIIIFYKLSCEKTNYNRSSLRNGSLSRLYITAKIYVYVQSWHTQPLVDWMKSLTDTLLTQLSPLLSSCFNVLSLPVHDPPPSLLPPQQCGFGIPTVNQSYFDIHIPTVNDRHFVLSTHTLHMLFNTFVFAVLTFACEERKEGRKCFNLTTHSTHFIYGYMASNIW